MLVKREILVRLAIGAACVVPISAFAEEAAETRLAALPEVIVIGERDNLRKIPGSGEILDADDIEESRVFTVNEAMRKVPGVFVRDEEGFGLRPNFGIRGLNPTRSTKLLLLEDGLPLSYAPYGDNASYYHPPVDRFERIEILKGSGQVLFGPHTVGGVINYITPKPPEDFGGHITASAGNRDFRDVHAVIGDTLGNTGYALNLTSKQTDGARENMHFDVLDLNGKLVQQLTDTQALTFRASFYDEDSKVPYSGLTLAEYQANPRYNPFVNDEFNIERWSSSLSHGVDVTDSLSITTAAYYTSFDRHWWRQSSNSGQRPSDASDPLCGGMANLLTTCGAEGRLRKYSTMGVESRATAEFALGNVDSEVQFGARWHRELQHRVQINADTPTGRTPGISVNGGVRENSGRRVEAWSAFVQNQMRFGAWSISPGVRIESIHYNRDERLTGAPGFEQLNQWIPGLGITYAPSESIMLFAGAHRGFGPPAVADIITGAGGSTDLDAELSWNYELGVRADPHSAVHLEATAFRMDFSNQVIPTSLAANACGASVCSAGKSLHQGVELTSQFDSSGFIDADHSVALRIAYTWLPDAEFVGFRRSSVDSAIDIDGNRLPYAPEHILTATLSATLWNDLRLQVETNYNDSVFTDDLNTVAVTANGQRGLLRSYTIWNATANYEIGDSGVTMFVTGKNVLDKLYVADMSRGLIPGSPRLIQVGVNYKF